MRILGISAFYHDSAAALLDNGRIVAAAQEERFSRKKHDARFPKHAVDFCLKEGKVGTRDVDYVVFYDKPFLKFERLLETYYAFAPKGFRSFLHAMPLWINKKILLRKVIKDELAHIQKLNRRSLKILFSDHHLSHAASAFFTSGFEQSAILTIDGVGEWSTATIGYGEGNNISINKTLNFPHSVGLLYSAFTYFLGFTVNSGEYKLMGLAPYGNATSARTKDFVARITAQLVDVRKDGSLLLNMRYFDFATSLRMVNEARWERLFGMPRREPESELTQAHM